MNKELISKIKSSKSINEMKELASKNGYSLTDEEATKYFNLFHNNGKINEQELDNFAGGAMERQRHGRWYYPERPYWLYVRPVECCALYKRLADATRPENMCLTCENVRHLDGNVFGIACNVRFWDNDPILDK